MGMRIGVASDHAGKDLKQIVVEFLRTSGFDVVDYGVGKDNPSSVDYPDFAALVAQDIVSNKLDRAVAICGTGIGMCIAVNRFPGVRAAVANDEYTARMSRAHNDTNILCLGARTTNHFRAIDYLKVWLETPFEEGRHRMRLDKIREIEKKVAKA